jgi:hypothetical protein
VCPYPDNDAAHALGPLQAKIVGDGNLNGTITMNLPNGQVLGETHGCGEPESLSLAVVNKSNGALLNISSP